MGRWIAIGRAPGWGDIGTFSANMKGPAKFRVDPTTTITTVFALEDGRVIAECHAVKREAFETWLRDQGWQVESVTPIKHVAKTGDIWKAG